MNEYYILKNIHDLLVQGFSENDLRHKLCQYQTDFEPLYAQLPQQADRETLAYHIIDYAHRQLKIESLLDWAQQNNSRRYKKHQPYLQEEVLPQPTEPLFSLIHDNDLGYGILLGGVYQSIPLRLAAIDWARYGRLGKVRSGWLYVPQWTTSHAIAFFKIHISDDGAGYIHIVDVAHPQHTIWLRTETGHHKEQNFHWISLATEVWNFTWKETSDLLFPMR
jgi:hypothetical protein